MSEPRSMAVVLDETLMLEVDRILAEIAAESGGMTAHATANARAAMAGALERSELDRFFVAQRRLKVILTRLRLRENVKPEELARI